MLINFSALANIDTAKYVVYILNAFTVFTALLMFTLGIVICVHYEDFFMFFEENGTFHPPTVLMVLGCVLILVTSFGSGGAFKEDDRVLLCFATFFVVVLSFEIGAWSHIYQLDTDSRELLAEAMKLEMARYGKPGFEQASTTWDELHQELQCCGTYNHTDWKSLKVNKGYGNVPRSCCTDKNDDFCGYGRSVQTVQATNGSIYTDGCLSGVDQAMGSIWSKLLKIGIIIAFMQFVGIAFSVWLAVLIINKRSTSESEDKPGRSTNMEMNVFTVQPHHQAHM